MNPRAEIVEYKDPYSLIVTFSNGEVKVFDLRPYLSYPVYESLKDESFCRTAKVKYGTIVWDDETDIDPDRLYLESKMLELSS